MLAVLLRNCHKEASAASASKKLPRRYHPKASARFARKSNIMNFASMKTVLFKIGWLVLQKTPPDNPRWRPCLEAPCSLMAMIVASGRPAGETPVS